MLLGCVVRGKGEMIYGRGEGEWNVLGMKVMVIKCLMECM